MSDENPITRVEFASLVDRVARTEVRIETCEHDRVAIRSDVTKLSEALARLDAKTDAQTVILERLDRAMAGILANPRVRALGWALLFAVTTWLASKGIGVPQ